MISVIVSLVSVTCIVFNAVLMYKTKKLLNTPMKPLIKEGYFIHDQSDTRYVFRKVCKLNIYDLNDDVLWELSKKDAPVLPIPYYKEIVFIKDKYRWTVSKDIKPVESIDNDTINDLMDKMSVMNFTQEELEASLSILKKLNKDLRKDEWY